jgi:hypothetical protein
MLGTIHRLKHSVYCAITLCPHIIRLSQTASFSPNTSKRLVCVTETERFLYEVLNALLGASAKQLRKGAVKFRLVPSNGPNFAKLCVMDSH